MTGPNPFEGQMKNLIDMYGSWNPMAYLKGMQQEGNAEAFNQNTLRQAQQETSLADLMNPHKIRQAAANANNTEAQLPGFLADSSLKANKADLSNSTFQQQLEELHKNHQFKNKDQELKEMEMGGRAYMQAEPLLATIPPPARHAAAKRLLGSFYQKEFDDIPPDQLGRVLNFVGSEMQGAQQKMFQATGIADKKAETAIQINDKRAQTQKEIAAFKASLSEKLAEAKKTGNKPENYEKTAAALLRAAQQEDDPERKVALYEEAQVFVSLKDASDKARAAQAAAGKVDVGATTGLPVNPQVPAPNVVPGSSPLIQNNPAMADPNMSRLPQGSKALGNGIYQLPDGRKIRAKQ